MVGHSIPHPGFMNISWFGVIYFESVVGAMGIGFGFERLVQIDKIVREVKLKSLDVFFLSLSFHEVLPSEEEIVE